MPRKPVKKSAAKARTKAAARATARIRTAAAARPAEHGRFDYSPIIDRPRLSWPNGARVAVWVIPNIEHFLFDRPSTPAPMPVNPDVLNYSWRDYGVRVGIWRMMEMMERHGVKGTVALNSDVCARLSAHHRGRQEARLGVDGPRQQQLDPVRRQSEAEERALIKESVDDHRQKHRQGAARLAQPGAQRDRAHARYPRRERHRICRQLGQRRAALSDAGEKGLDDLDALFGLRSTTSRLCSSLHQSPERSAR